MSYQKHRSGAPMKVERQVQIIIQKRLTAGAGALKRTGS
jgi:hypothetical protein